MTTFMTRTALALAAVLWLHGCADMPSNAPIDDRTGTRDKAAKPVAKKAQEPVAASAPADPPGFYTVKKGDTLNRIAQQFSQAPRDLVDWNHLSNPNDIKVGQQLRVAPPEDSQVASVPVDTGMEMRALDGPAATEPPAQPVRTLGGLKTAPMGNKVAYTDQTWADLQRVEPARPLDSRKPADGAAAARFIWPTEGKLIRGFDAGRKGIDIAGQAGQPVMAAGDGTVLYANNMRGYGNLVIIDHRDGVVSAYAHNKTILVKEGQSVTKGQRIAEMGDTDAESVRLHFEIRQLGKPVDPISFLPSR